MAQDGFSTGFRVYQQISSAILQVISTLEDLLLKIIQDDSDPIAKELINAIKKGENGCVATVNPQDLPELQARLKEAGLGREGYPMYTQNRVLDDGTMVADIVVLGKDAKLLQNEIAKMEAEKLRGGNIGFTNMQTYSNGNHFVYNNMSAVQAQAMQERCEQMNIKYAMKGPTYIGLGDAQQEGRCSMCFAEKDKDLVEAAMCRAAYDIKGPAGKLYQEHLQFENKYKTQAMNAMISGKLPSDKLAEGTTMVHENGTTLQATKSGLTLSKPGEKPITIKRDDKNLQKKIAAEFSKGKIAIYTPEHKEDLEKFKQAQSPEERKAMIEKARGTKMDEFVVKSDITDEDRRIIEKHAKEQAQIEEKLQQEHPALERIPEDITTSPFQTYMQSQNINGIYSEGMTQTELPDEEKNILDVVAKEVADMQKEDPNRDITFEALYQEEVEQLVLNGEEIDSNSQDVTYGLLHGTGRSQLDLSQQSNGFTDEQTYQQEQSFDD